mmetsp:Transcript_7802/g.20159  ORF Transcript_7802/g.20159 Transcript_7802/m.20159 type:complete len:112 (-) Transcript_7802:138-473(-)
MCVSRIISVSVPPSSFAFMGKMFGGGGHNNINIIQYYYTFRLVMALLCFCTFLIGLWFLAIKFGNLHEIGIVRDMFGLGPTKEQKMIQRTEAKRKIEGIRRRSLTLKEEKN